MKKSGFVDIVIDTRTVSPEYAKEWGFELDINQYLKDYIRTSSLSAYKPK
ncbi:hypothetical protein [Peptostreptococcus porci]|nr:hypothetical protein [Peptostreptococcus porci]MDY2793797.1 hypothetical protein [Peptostreptococcus porci]MDY4128851.1 hypothetical protein [Peptostreptococcus porci]MDY4560670.1 hypothetical protein [Peptostreptococcus porci]MDY5435131.1 hypothetical protein [Peptostreptococcus porci]MDY5479785.1 hypothetical protein [Peptostreptococcus porci]